MASISACSSQRISSFYRNPFSKSSISCPFSLSFPLGKARFCSIKAVLDGGGGVVRNTQETTSYGTDLLRKPAVLSPGANDEEELASEYPEEDESETKGRDGDTWVDWENQILEDTVPLVGFVRMLLHSGKYEVGHRLSLQHERMILERLLPHHPEWEKKIGSGVDYITVGYHPDFDTSRCLFIVRRDGELVDFSYWKCIKGLIRKNYPLYAESFILRHFRRGRRPN